MHTYWAIHFPSVYVSSLYVWLHFFSPKYARPGVLATVSVHPAILTHLLYWQVLTFCTDPHALSSGGDVNHYMSLTNNSKVKAKKAGQKQKRSCKGSMGSRAHPVFVNISCSKKEKKTPPVTRLKKKSKKDNDRTPIAIDVSCPPNANHI